MIAKVERISRINSIGKDLGSYGQRQGYADSNGGQSFEHELKSAMQGKRQDVKKSEIQIDQPYVLSVTRATHSLFYQNGIPEERIGNILHGIR